MKRFKLRDLIDNKDNINIINKILNRLEISKEDKANILKDLKNINNNNKSDYVVRYFDLGSSDSFQQEEAWKYASNIIIDGDNSIYNNSMSLYNYYGELPSISKMLVVEGLYDTNGMIITKNKIDSYIKGLEDAGAKEITKEEFYN